MTNWDPKDYHQHSAQQQKWARHVLRNIRLAGHESILDIGCGDGKITAEIARALPQGNILAIDSSHDMIDFANRTFPRESFPNLQFQLGDARALSFSSRFDLVVSFACLHWVIDHRPVLAGIARALRPGGRVFLQCGGKGNAADVVAAIHEVTRRPQWAPYFVNVQFPWGFHSPDEYRPWLQAAGLKPLRVELIPKDMTHDGPAGFAGWLRTTWMPYFKRVPENSQQQFLDEAAAEYIKTHPADPQGLVHLNMVRLEVEAEMPIFAGKSEPRP